MSTLSKSSESGSVRDGPNGSDVANGLSAFGLPSILLLLESFVKTAWVHRSSRLRYEALGTRCILKGL